MSVVGLFVEYEPVILLLRTLEPNLQSPFDFQEKTATGAAIAQNTKAEAREGNPQTILCRSCHGGGKQRVCRTCRGTGAEVVDQYTGRRLMTETQEGEAKPPRMVRCDGCGGTGEGVWWRNGDELTNTCRRCWGAKVVPAPDYPVRPWRESPLMGGAQELGPEDPVAVALEIGMRGAGRAYEQRVQAGDYEPLGLALACLRLDRPPLYRLVVGIYVLAEREPEQLHVDEALRMGVGLHYVRALMPEEIRVPSWAARYEKRRRERVESESKAA